MNISTKLGCCIAGISAITTLAFADYSKTGTSYPCMPGGVVKDVNMWSEIQLPNGSGCSLSLQQHKSCSLLVGGWQFWSLAHFVDKQRVDSWAVNMGLYDVAE